MRRCVALLLAWATLLSGLSLLSPLVQAELLPPGVDRLELPFETALGKAMLAVEVNGRAGRMMLDTGTPEPVMFNRDALRLTPGQAVGQGRATSGQPVLVERTEAPELRVLGRRIPLAAQAMSGNFQFVEAGFGADFMGFIGGPMLGRHAFLLDHRRQRLVLYRVDASGALRAPPAQRPLAEVDFSLPPGGLPTTVGLVGGRPMLLDFDTGDSGTLYLRPASLAALLVAGQVERVALAEDGGDGDGEGAALILRSLSFGGREFSDLRLQLREAGSSQDFRSHGQPELLRLGADFMARYPSLWNYPAHRLSLLPPGGH